MNLDQAHTQSGAPQRAQSQAEARLRGGWLILARTLWLVVLALSVGLFISSIPFIFADAHVVCSAADCSNNSSLTAVQARELQNLGLSLDFYAYLGVAWSIFLECIYIAVGVVIFWRRSDDWIALLGSLSLVTFGAIFRGFNPEPSLSLVLYILSLVMAFFGNCCIGLFFYLFPSGHFAPRWVFWIALAWVLYWAVKNLILGMITTNSGPDFVIFLCLLLSMVVTQVYRYRRVSTFEQRRQTKWVVFGLSLALLGFLSLMIVASVILLPIIPDLIGSSLLYVFLSLIPLSIGVAILRSHLWDIDIIIKRALIYGALTAFVVALYVLVVVGLGALLQASGNLLISLLATGLVAVLFQPLRERLQQVVNRLLYGERTDPYKVISRLGSRLEAALAPETVLPTIVETVAQALKLPYVAIALKEGSELLTTASYGELREKPLSLSLTYQSEQIGELILAPRGPAEPFSAADRQLLNDLARQAGIAAHAIRLTTDLQLLTGDLQQSRTQLVTAREEERRRLRRDLHDGLGPALATITLQAEAARDAISTEPDQAVFLLEGLINQAQTAISDIRRLVYDLRPPALDDLGLIAAVRAQIMHYEHTGLRVTIDAPSRLPELSAAVEVAAYRIIQEALTNVMRHAGARSCLIQLDCDDALNLAIRDDGRGLPAEPSLGVGIRSMRERAAELGGSCSVENVPSGGTRVNVVLPLETKQQE
ncbi:hypothetical protein KSD_46780 [Ktedonobacter sp. SOSP1-85]|uniref:sensor histidine kinase n=1 Tax=Ktedonobacter sp. SOSP1-85 TaxID=2778367 RepID=UPI0019166C44|nr:GAF domain-containing sensor histidine kinase [Ktedonobacter sp. SOSP1-85]GHO76907.1 hypothetical protein KSD_46780 [Ktedonobacter sp. SOSP1-85]